MERPRFLFKLGQVNYFSIFFKSRLVKAPSCLDPKATRQANTSFITRIVILLLISILNVNESKKKLIFFLKICMFGSEYIKGKLVFFLFCLIHHQPNKIQKESLCFIYHYQTQIYLSLILSCLIYLHCLYLLYFETITKHYIWHCY
jgi:hypothetical protein